MTVTYNDVLKMEIKPLPLNKRGRVLKILAEEAAAARLDPELVRTSRARTGEIRMVRWKTFYRAHHGVGMSLPEIGRLFGYDHTTVLHAIRRVKDMIDNGELTMPVLGDEPKRLQVAQPMTYTAQVSSTLGGHYARGPKEHPSSQNA